MSFDIHPVDEDLCRTIAEEFIEKIDDDVEDIFIHAEDIQYIWERLTNDEKLAVFAYMDFKPEGCRKKYKTICRELINAPKDMS